VSVHQVSVGLASRVYGELGGRSVLLIGAGEVCSLAARSLIEHGVSRVSVANRTQENIQDFVNEYNASVHGLDEIGSLLSEVDLVVSCTASSEIIVTQEMMHNALPSRRHRPLVILDLAVPRDVDPEIGQMTNIYLFDIDDLNQLLERNRNQRKEAAREAEQLIAKQATAFQQRLRGEQISPTIVRLRDTVLEIRASETDELLQSMGNLSDDDRARLKRMSHNIVNRILHRPMIGLKQLAEDGMEDVALDVVEKLFFEDSKNDKEVK
jgi:glutamyl-tRNA reductase